VAQERYTRGARPTCVRVNLAAISRNLAGIRRYAPGSKLLFAVKANAYGHGSLQVAAASQTQVDGFAVASLAEAVKLRTSGIAKPILLLSGHFSREELADIAKLDLWTTAHSAWQIEDIKSFRKLPRRSVWIKIDTGMHRLGVAPEDVPNAVHALSSLEPEGSLTLFTHMSSADEFQGDETDRQNGVIHALAQRFGLPSSQSNSAAVFNHPATRSNWVRVGLGGYGIHPANMTDLNLEPAMSFISKIVAIRNIPKGDGVGYNLTWRAVRDSTIATIPVGYGDGYPRHAGNRASVLIGDHLCPLAGCVSMDMITVDVTEIRARIRIGTRVELWGKRLSVTDVAQASQTNAYELVTRVSDRPFRVYDTSITDAPAD